MGLRLVAHYYDRVEALIVSATLDAAGVPNWVENYLQNAVQPFYEIGLGGFRVMVCEQDVINALDVLSEARAMPISEGGRLVSRPILWEPTIWLFPVLLLVRDWWGFAWIAGFVVGLLMPVRRREWRDN